MGGYEPNRDPWLFNMERSCLRTRNAPPPIRKGWRARCQTRDLFAAPWRAGLQPQSTTTDYRLHAKKASILLGERTGPLLVLLFCQQVTFGGTQEHLIVVGEGVGFGEGHLRAVSRAGQPRSSALPPPTP